ncbi:MAG: hypothetical protein JO210_02465 [Acidobacteriaceae bacterium]|nr:hypothetical protein [Acidobacteriaceae bacterium]
MRTIDDTDVGRVVRAAEENKPAVGKGQTSSTPSTTPGRLILVAELPVPVKRSA